MLGPAHAGFQLGSHVGGHVLAVGVAAGDVEAEVAVACKVRNLEEQVDLLFQQAVGALQRSRLLAAEEVVAGDVGQHARADAGLARGIAVCAAEDDQAAVVVRRSGLGLEAEAVGERPAARLHRLHQHRLSAVAACRVFHRRIDLVEQGELVEIALRVHQGGLVERIAGMDGDGPRHRVRAGVMEPGQQHLAHKNLLPLGDVEDHVHLAGSEGSACWVTSTCGLLEPPAQIVGHQGIAVSGQDPGRKQLARRWCSAAGSAGPHPHGRRLRS